MADAATVTIRAETDKMCHTTNFVALLETIVSDSQCLAARALDLDIVPDFY